MKVALLTTDSREHYRDYANAAPSFGAAPEALLQGFQALSGVEVHLVSCLKQPVTSPARLAPNIFYHALCVPKLGWMRTAYLGCSRAVRRKLAEIRPDIVHGQGTERDCALSAIRSRWPNVVTIHGNMAALARLFGARIGSFAWLAARLEDYTLRRTAGVFCNSAYTEDFIRPRARRTWRVPNAIREVFFGPSATPPDQRCVLLNIGVISPRKRQVELLDLALELRRQGLDFELQFLGYATPGDAYAETFLERMKAGERAGCARYLGLKSTDEIVAHFDRAHGLVHFPSEEAFGLVVPEALARGLKFFGSRLGGIMDIATNVPGAELFEAEDWGGLAQSLAAWLRSGFPRSTEAQPLMRERYHPQVIARRHVEIYREVLSSAR